MVPLTKRQLDMLKETKRIYLHVHARGWHEVGHSYTTFNTHWASSNVALLYPSEVSAETVYMENGEWLVTSGTLIDEALVIRLNQIVHLLPRLTSESSQYKVYYNDDGSVSSLFCPKKYITLEHIDSFEV